MFDRKTVLVCSVLLMAGGLAVPSIFPAFFIISVTGMVAVIAVPIIRFFMVFCWNMFFKGLSDKIQSKNGKAIFNLFFAPPREHR